MSEELTKEECKKLIFERVEAEYKFYEDLKLLIDVVGVEYEALPKGLLNEVRDFTGHISDAIIKEQDSLEDREGNIERARHHLRRIQLDCYKMLCVNAFNQVNAFKKQYRFYNLSDVDDGNFVQNLDKKYTDAKEAVKKAKFLDANGKNSKQKPRNEFDEINAAYQEPCKEFDNVHKAYEAAYNSYQEVIHYIDKHKQGASRIAKKHRIRTILGVLGWALSAVLSGVVGYWINELLKLLQNVS